MVTSVSSSPYYSYLSQLQSGASTASTPATAVSTAATDASKTTSSSLVSSLLSGGSYSTSVLSLLQENSSGSFDPVSSLLGGQTTDTAITKLYSGIYDSAAAATLQKAQTDNTPSTTSTTSAGTGSFSQNLINSQTQASIAYNQTIQQNAATAVAASKVRTDAITSVIS